MSKEELNVAGSEIPDHRRNKPAVGFVTTGEHSNELAGAILRARRSNHQSIVVAMADADSEAVHFAEELGAVVVRRDGRKFEDPRKQLVSLARERGFPGVIYQGDVTETIDLDRSVESLHETSSFVTDAERLPSTRSNTSTIVGVPAYNEADTIDEVVTEASQYCDCVVVVDDGSDDDTAGVARTAGATVVEHDTNEGYGSALNTLFEEARLANADHLVVLDGDGQHDPADIPRLIETQRETESEMVIGSRFEDPDDGGIPLYRRVGLAVVNRFTNLSLGAIRPGSGVGDTQSGFRVYDERAIASLAADDSIGSNMGASTDILHHAYSNGYDIEEVGTTVDYDVDGASHHNPVHHGVMLVMNLVRTIERERPISILGVPGFLSIAVGLGFAYWTFTNYIRTGTFPKGLAVISGFLSIAGVFACFTAIILHSLSTHMEQNG